MRLGYELIADVRMNDDLFTNCNVVPALDTTLTIRFNKGARSMGELDELFNSAPTIEIIEGGTVVKTYENKRLQAYRVDASGTVEVSFLSDIEPIVEEPFMNEPIEESEENADEE